MSHPEAESTEPRARQPLGADFIIPAMAVGLTGYYLISTLDLVWEAKATGICIGLALLALCVAHLARLGVAIASGRGDWSTGTLFADDPFNRQRLWLAVMVLAYVVTIYWVGATVGLFFLLIGCMRLLGVTSLRTLVGVSFVAAAFVHLALITLLDSKLPQGWLLNAIAKALGGA
jgi:hypothetical protein